MVCCRPRIPSISRFDNEDGVVGDNSPDLVSGGIVLETVGKECRVHVSLSIEGKDWVRGVDPAVLGSGLAIEPRDNTVIPVEPAIP